MSITEQIKSRLDIVDVVSESVTLKKSGRNYAGFCPFHANSRTPSFFIFPDTQTWRCFGACAEGGDVFSFVMKQQGLEFKETLEQLAVRTGVELEAYTPEQKKRRTHEEKLIDLVEAAADYYHQLFLHAPQAEDARQYMAARGLTAETIATFKVGYSLDSWDACRTHFNSQGYTDQELLEAGLLKENEEKGRRFDHFRGRLMVPIRNVDGRAVGFGARTLDPDGVPKYINSPQDVLFNKSRLLFGLDLAKRAIREARQAVIVEGYMDMIQLWQAGFHNVVAQMGTASTEEQLTLLKRYAKRFVLALDADAAGAKATMRSLQVARETLDRDVDVQFDAYGLVRQEGRLQADIRIVTLPVGEDPDSIVRANPETWTQLVAQAKPVVMYVIETAVAGLDMRDAKAKTAVAQQVIPLIKDIADPLERDHYWQALARALQVDARSLRQIRLPEKPGTAVAKQQPTAPAVSGKLVNGWTAVSRKASSHNLATATEMKQLDYLSQCLRQPRLLELVNGRLRQCEQTAVGEDEFLLPEDRAIMRHLYQWHTLGTAQTRQTVVAVDDLWDILDSALADRAQYLLSLPPAPDTEIERLANQLMLSVLDWRLEKTRGLVEQVEQYYKEAQRENDADAVQLYQQLQRELPVTMRALNKARNAMTAANRRRVAT